MPTANALYVSTKYSREKSLETFTQYCKQKKLIYNNMISLT